MKHILSTSIAIVTGLIVLSGYFIDFPGLVDLRRLILDWAIILGGVLIFMGVINLLSVNLNRFNNKQKGGTYSLVLILAMVVTLLLGFIYRPGHPVMNFIFNTFQLPVEKSLMALLAVTLLLAGTRLLRQQINLFSVIFLVTALIILLGTVPLPFGELPFISNLIKPFIAQVLAAAGARGILLGVALATLTTGLRILVGVDRPYGGK